MVVKITLIGQLMVKLPFIDQLVVKITFIDRLVVRITPNHLFVVNNCITLVDLLVVEYL